MSTDENELKDDNSIIEIEELLSKAKNINEEINSVSKEFNEGIDNLENEIKKDSAEIETDLKELDKAEKKAEGEIEELMMQNAESMAKEEDVGNEE
jgi:seryl-tRNA synthetase